MNYLVHPERLLQVLWTISLLKATGMLLVYQLKRSADSRRETLMNKVNVTEAQTVNGGAGWYCTGCHYQSNWHLFLSTANSYARKHRNDTNHSVIIYN